MKEVLGAVNVSQFFFNETQFACGFVVAAELKYAGPPGARPTGTPDQVHAWADKQYDAEYGSHGINQTGGVSTIDMRRLLLMAGYKCQDIAAINANSTNDSDVAHIKAAVQLGYPVVITVLEASVMDLDLGINPYFWGPSGTHVMYVTGIADDGNLAVRDSANIEGQLNGPNTVRQGPRRYSISEIHWGTVVQMPWLPALPANFDPMVGLAPTPTQLQAFSDQWKSTGTAMGGVPRTGTGIYNAWLKLLAAGCNVGPPLTQEYPSVSRGGKAVTVQEFARARCEWDGMPHWVGVQGNETF